LEESLDEEMAFLDADLNEAAPWMVPNGGNCRRLFGVGDVLLFSPVEIHSKWRISIGNVLKIFVGLP